MRARLANGAWMVAAWRARTGFDAACDNPESAQRAVLADILDRGRQCSFVTDHGLIGVRTAERFAEQLAPQSWNGFASYVERVAAGQASVLTDEPVELLEPTSGTTGPLKLVPVTASLRAAFAEVAAVWVADIFAAYPAARGGRSYWSVTPVSSVPRRSEGGIPIGFDEDVEYFGPVRRTLARWAMAVPGDVRHAAGIETARYLMLLFLLAAEDLSLVSIWSPTFLAALLERLPHYRSELVRDLGERRVRPPGGIDPHLATALERQLRVDVHRVRRVQDLLSGPDISSSYAVLWPHLSVISCWADANAASPAATLASAFPRAALQPKGLLSTEAFATVPIHAAPDPVLAVGTHYFEFLPDASDTAVPAWRVEQDHEYELVVTTQGGLYRYRTGDRVRVTGRYRSAPTLRFLGKTGLISDRVGEKLAEAHVLAALSELRSYGVCPAFELVAFSPARRGYRLYIERPKAPAGVDAEFIACVVDEGLRRNPHYAYAQDVGQLARLDVVVVGPTAPGAFIDHHVRGGARAGDVKPIVLSEADCWDAVFDVESSG